MRVTVINMRNVSRARISSSRARRSLHARSFPPGQEGRNKGAAGECGVGDLRDSPTPFFFWHSGRRKFPTRARGVLPCRADAACGKVAALLAYRAMLTEWDGPVRCGGMQRIVRCSRSRHSARPSRRAPGCVERARRARKPPGRAARILCVEFRL